MSDSNLSNALLAELCQAAIVIAKQASAAIMSVYQREFTIAHKDDASPLTEADTVAHQIIERGLKNLAPRFPMLSEESSERIFEDRQRWKRFWLVDPLDGTKEFISKNGEFTVNIALIEDGQPVLGIVAAPSPNWVAYASAGAGAWKRSMAPDHGSAWRLQTRSAASLQCINIGASRSHYKGEIGKLVACLGEHAFKPQGSALKFVSLANGEIDLYPRLSSSSSEWDIAAGHCIVREAGGEVLGRDGKPLTYNQRDSVLMPAFIAVGDTQQAWLERLQWLEKT